MKRWPTKPLCEVALVTAGDPAPQRAEDFSDDGIPFVRMQDVGRFGQTTCLAKTKDQLSASASPKFKRFPAGSILVPKSGASIRLNHRAILGIEAHVVSHLAVIVPQASLNTRFAYYWLCGIDLSGVAHDADLPSMKTSELAKLQLPVPPLAEQERIVKLLDEADELRKLRAQAEHRTAALIPALFHEMFGDPISNSFEWHRAPLGTYIEFLTSGSRGWAKYYADNGAIFLRIQNVGNNELLLDDLTYVTPPDNAEANRTKVRSGDVLLSITADLGRAATIPEGFPLTFINQHLALLRLRELDPIFVAATLSSASAKLKWLDLNRSAVKSGLNFDDIRSFPMIVPPLTLQQKFARLASEIRELEAAQAASRQRVEHLFQSMLHRAFNQEL